MNRKRRHSSLDFDEQEAFRKSCAYTVMTDVFVAPEVTVFMEVVLDEESNLYAKILSG